jgi:hypothetical protein
MSCHLTKKQKQNSNNELPAPRSLIICCPLIHKIDIPITCLAWSANSQKVTKSVCDIQEY